jgi:hypothetical protein
MAKAMPFHKTKLPSPGRFALFQTDLRNANVVKYTVELCSSNLGEFSKAVDITEGQSSLFFDRYLFD